MLVCTACLHVDDRAIEHCPTCGESAFAKATKNGELVSVPAEAGMPCQSCYATERELKFRYYRRVAGMVFADRIWGEAGYFCSGCRGRHFRKNMGLTLLLGWWGMFALVFRNPYAIFVNVWALFRPPFGPGVFGAMNVAEIRATAEREQERDKRLADVYMRMPGWIDSLTEEDIERVLTDSDLYSVLGASPSASHAELRALWRERIKEHHPDRAGEAGHEATVALNDAWKVLGDERLRHAYDHRDELLAFVREADAAASDLDDDVDDVEMVVGCVECRLGFASFDDAADHVDQVHPHTDYDSVLVWLEDDDESEEAAAQWRCKTCLATFPKYDDALEHADRAHPERTTIDPRSGVEAI